MKKLSSLLVAAVLTVAMVMPVFAGSTSAPAAASTPAAAETVYTTPSGQVITPAVVAAYAAAVTTNGGTVAPVDVKTTIAISNYLKSIGSNAAVIANFVDSAKPGKNTISCPSIIAGLNYKILVQFADGTVKLVDPTSVTNGSITYKKPAGNVASIAIVLQ